MSKCWQRESNDMRVAFAFPSAEYPATINRDELGNLGLTPEEEEDLVVFMETLTDVASQK